VSGYKTIKTSMGHKIRVKMSRQEIRERRILQALIIGTPMILCWLFAYAGGML